MKRFLQFFSLILLTMVISNANAQRYLEEVFTDDEIIVESGIVYATNIDFLISNFAGVNTGVDLGTLSFYADSGLDYPAAYLDPTDGSTDVKLKAITMDVYYPDLEVDDIDERPVIIFLHTGNFLPPPLNGGTSGLMTDSSAVNLCQQWAKRGYVAVSADYRLGWNPLAETVQERRGGLLNAVYRALQDSKMAVRYLRADAEGDNQWGIDESKIVLYGQGSGGYLTQAYTTLDNPTVELYLDKFVPNPFEPETSYIDSLSVGNIEGWGFSFGVDGIEPDTLSLNLYRDNGISADVNMSINAGGALADESWLEAGDVPMIAINCVRDDFAPFTEGTVIVPTTQEDVVDVHGANFFIQKANDLGNNDAFASIPDGDPYTDRARSLYGTSWESSNDGTETINETPEGLFPLVLPLTSFLTNQAGPWEWWDPNSPIALTEVAPGITAHMASLQSNPGMSPEKGLAYLDTIQGYINPRIMCVLDLPGAICEGSEEAPANDICDQATDINDLFGGDLGTTNSSEVMTNVGATTENDPEDGWECFGEPDGSASDPTLESTTWYTFEGDGGEYTIETSDCNGALTDSYISDGDTQFAIYSGTDCTDLVAVADGCNEDSEDATDGDYFAGANFLTEPGVTYYVMIDGFDATDLGGGPSVGEFCVDVTMVTVNVEELELNTFSVFPNPTTDKLTINAKQNITAYTVYDLLGKIVASENLVNTGTVLVDMRSFDTGVYIVDVEINGQTSSQRVIKK